jgi:acyl carrier protein
MAADRDALWPRLRAILARMTGLPEDGLNQRLHLEEDLCFDVLDFAEVAIEAEAAFRIAIDDVELMRIERVAELLDLIAGKVARLPQGAPA